MTPRDANCLGSQLLAPALGARVYASGRPEIGWIPVSLEPDAAGDTMLGDAPRTFTPLRWHGDVLDLPGGAVRLARAALTANRAVAVLGELVVGRLNWMIVALGSRAGPRSPGARRASTR